jgi:hypothetical protein
MADNVGLNCTDLHRGDCLESTVRCERFKAESAAARRMDCRRCEGLSYPCFTYVRTFAARALAGLDLFHAGTGEQLRSDRH